jgi:hypothetical protein
MHDYQLLIQQLLHSGQADINQIGLLRIPATTGHADWENLSLPEKSTILGNPQNIYLSFRLNVKQIRTSLKEIFTESEQAPPPKKRGRPKGSKS